MPLATHVRLLDAQEPDHEGPIDKLAFELVLATRLKPGDLVLCTAGDVVPAARVVVVTLHAGGCRAGVRRRGLSHGYDRRRRSDAVADRHGAPSPRATRYTPRVRLHHPARRRLAGGSTTSSPARPGLLSRQIFTESLRLVRSISNGGSTFLCPRATSVSN